MNTAFNNSPAYFREVKDILQTLSFSDALTFNQARKLVFNSEALRQLVEKSINQPIVALSSGTSQALAFPEFIRQVGEDMQQQKYYRDYTPTAGNREARLALALAESERLQTTRYTEEDLCLTEGSTGAITAVLETFQRNKPDGELLIASPAYYLYKAAAKYFDISYREVNLLPQAKQDTVSLQPLIDSITSRTKMIILCNPSNPGGEVYSRVELTQLMTIAQQRKILILIDELFAELVFPNQDFTSSDRVAEEIGAFDSLCVIKGYSKSKNLAGFRIGYLLTKNKQLMNQVLQTVELRQCFPVASLFTGLICLETFLRTVQLRVNGKQTLLQDIVKKTQLDFQFCDAVRNKTVAELVILFTKYQLFANKQLQDYQTLYQQAAEELDDLISLRTKTSAAFNTLVKIDSLKNVNQFAFTVGLYIQTGIKIEIGPCFGWDQQTWQQDPNLGFWLRLSFSQAASEYIRGLRTLRDFIPYYLENEQRFGQLVSDSNSISPSFG